MPVCCPDFVPRPLDRALKSSSDVGLAVVVAVVLNTCFVFTPLPRPLADATTGV